MSNVSGRNDAKAEIEHKLPLSNGYSLEWGGQYENQKRAQQRLAIVFPISVLIIAALLYATFHDIKQTLLILLIVPLALVGGIAALWIRGINLNLSASVGFIALFGIAVTCSARRSAKRKDREPACDSFSWQKGMNLIWNRPMGQFQRSRRMAERTI